jgi:hypothetical protein
MKLGFLYFNTRLVARSQYASGRSCDRPTRSICSVALLRPRTKAQSVTKIHVALHASHAAVPMLPTFRHNAAVSPDVHFLPCAAYCLQSTSKRLTLQPTFTRRTSGHSLGNFREVNFLFVPYSPDSLSLCRDLQSVRHYISALSQRSAPQDDTGCC